MNKKYKKKTGLLRYKDGIGQAINGIVYAIEKEWNLLFIMFFIILTLGLCLAFPVTVPELLAIVISAGTLMAIEMINTSVESLTDLVTTKDYPLAKIVKDSVSGAVFIFVIIFVSVLGIIFIPKIMSLF